MLTQVNKRPVEKAGGDFVIVASEYNARFVDAMLKEAKKELQRAGVNRVEVVRVPGAFEIPVAVSKLLRVGNYSGVICLGVILRGATAHANHIGEAVTRALMQLQVSYQAPVVHEVLLLESEEQAVERCLGKKYNRGLEAAQTALKMADVMRHI